MTLPDLEEVTTEGFGFKLASSKYGIKLFDSPIDFEKSFKESFPLRLLSVGYSKDLYAASNTKAVTVGKLRDLDDAETAKEKLVSFEFPNVSHVSFNSTNEELCIVANGQIHKATVSDLFEAQTSPFTPVESKDSIIDFQMHYADPSSYFYITSSHDLYITNNSQEEHISNVKSACWNPQTSDIGLIENGLLKVGKFTASKSDQEDWGELLHISCIDKCNWLVVGSIEDDEDLVYTLVTLSGDSLKQAQSIFMAPPMGCAQRYHSFYVANTINWIPKSTLSFITYGLSTEITTLQIDEETRILVPSEDINRGELPMDADSGEDLVPVGFAVDLSGKDITVETPCNGVEKAKGVLPRILCLSDQGQLIMWYVFISKAINDGSASLTNALDQAIYSPFELKLNSTNSTSTNISSAVTKENKVMYDDNKEELKGEEENKKDQETQEASDSGQTQTTGFGKAGFGSATLADTIKAFNDSAKDANATGNQATFGTSSFGNSSFGKVSFGESTFGKSSFGNKSNAAQPFGLLGMGSLGSNFGNYSKFGSSKNDSPFTAMSGSKNIFGANEESPFAALNKKNSIFDTDEKKSDAEFNVISTPTKFENIENSVDSITPAVTDASDALDNDFDESSNFNDLNEDEDDEDSNSYSSESQFDLEGAENSEEEFNAEDSNWVDVNSPENSEDIDSLLSLVKKDLLSDEYPEISSKDYVAPKNSNNAEQSEQSKQCKQLNGIKVDAFNQEKLPSLDLSSDKKEQSSEVESLDIPKFTSPPSESLINKDMLLGKKEDELEEDKNAISTMDDFLEEKEYASERNNAAADTTNESEANGVEPTKEPTPEPEPRKALNEILSETEFVQFAGFTNPRSYNNTIADKMEELIQIAQGQLDVFETNANLLGVLFTAYSEPNPDPPVIVESEKEDINEVTEPKVCDDSETETEEETDSDFEQKFNDDKKTEDFLERQDLTLANIEDLANEVLSSREKMIEKLDYANAIDLKVKEVVEGYSQLELQRLEVQKAVDLVQRFSDSMNSSLVQKRPMSLNAQRLKLSIRVKLARVKELHEEVLQKLVPFGLALDLDETPAARIERVESIIRQIMAKSRIYREEIQLLEQQLAFTQRSQTHLEDKKATLLITGSEEFNLASVESRLAFAEKLECSKPSQAEIIDLDS